jgi:hypothetical protein
MAMTAAFAFAWLLCFASGAAVWLALSPRRVPGWRSAALGHGLLLGMLLATAATALVARADTTRALAQTCPWLFATTLLAAFVAWYRTPGAVYKQENAAKWKSSSVLLGLACVSLLWRGWIALREILLRPTYPWDAWDAWSVKSKTWVLLGHYAPFVPISDWLRHPAQELYTSIAWGYPPTLAWMQVWFASAVGGWIEPLVNLPWFALWLGLLLGHYGQWRALGFTRTQALAGTYALGSLPLLDVHVALAGYADLWVAAVLGFGVLAWLRWMRFRDRAQFALAIGCCALLPMLKLEGAVWLLLFAAMMTYGLLPRLWRRRAFMTLTLLFALLALARGFKLPVPGLGWVSISRDALTVPVIGHLTVAWHPAAFRSVLNSLFEQPNWHLLWWLVPPIVIWRWRELRASEPTRQLGCLVLGCVGFLLFLFLFTDAASWAESYTAINRLLMHVVPALVTFLMLLLRDVDWFGAAPRRLPAPVPHSVPK